MSQVNEVAEPPDGIAAAASHISEPESRLGVLRHAYFRRVWIGAAISSVGGWMEQVGVQWIVSQQAQTPEWAARGYPSATLMMGYLAAAHLTPMLLLGITGGVLADRVNRKKLLLVTQALLMVIAAAIAAASLLGVAGPWVLTWLMAAMGATMAFNVPAWQVLTPRLVPRSELTRAITLNGIQFNLARVVGPALAGVVLAINQDSASPLFVLNTLSFLAVLIAVWGTPDAPAPAHDGRNSLSKVREALAFTFLNKGPLMTFLAMVIFSMLAAPLLRMLPLFVSQVYVAKANAFGMMLAVMGIGAVAGGLGLKYVPPWYPKHHLIPASVTLGGFSILFFSVCTNPYWAGVWMFFCGAFWLTSFNSSMAAMQLLVGDAMRGRVLAVCNTVVFGSMAVGSVLAGLIGDSVGGHNESGEITGYGVQVGVGSMAAVLAVAGLVMLIWRTPEVDGLVPGQPGYARRPGLIRGITAASHRPGRSEPIEPPLPG